jgi:hypothetical protein
MVNAFSFCLYGPPNPRYYNPLIENLRILQREFPDWKAWVHFAPDVDAGYIRVLETFPNVVLRHTEKVGAINMIERFFTIDEPGVDLMVVRDADSLIHWRDQWAIRQFLAHPEADLHVVRDHPAHGIRIPGGLWALRKSAGLCIRDEYALYLRDPKDYGIAHDQNFLNAHIYPKLVGRIYVTYSGEGNRFTGEAGDPFPLPWTEDLYCGRIEIPPPREVPSLLRRITRVRVP